MTGNLQAIGFVFSWVLGWGIGGSLIDAGLINAGVYSLEGGQLGTAATFILWSLVWGGGGVWLYRHWTVSISRFCRTSRLHSIRWASIINGFKAVVLEHIGGLSRKWQ